jgi:hypothetical protein
MIKFQQMVLFLIPTLILGCGATKWSHPSLTENDFYRDRELCSRYASSVNPDRSLPFDPYLDPMQQSQVGYANAGSQFGRALGMESSFKNCMYGKGWRDSK